MSENGGNGAAHAGKMQALANNATVIVLARISAVFGVPAAALVGLAVWNDVRELKRDFAAQNTTIAVVKAEQAADRQTVAGWYGALDRRVVRIEDTLYYAPAARESAPPAKGPSAPPGERAR